MFSDNVMKILIDKNIPFINGVFEPFALVAYLKGDEFTPDSVSDADILIIRTRTKCNEALLKGSSVKFIATATIGTDHIDLDYCKNSGIGVANAAGCNAGGVMQYVFTALYYLSVQKGFELPCGKECSSLEAKKVLGVIGVGNVGTKVADLGELLGFEVLRCDPLKEREQTLAFNRGEIKVEDFKDFYSLDYLLENSDIVTMHTWLDDTTRGMADEAFFAKMKWGSVFINASRGEVVVDKALVDNAMKFSAIVVDVWNGEPQINPELLAVTDIATPHIAGYSYEGKLNGTSMSVRSVGRFADIPELFDFSAPTDSPNTNFLDFSGLNKEQINEQLSGIFPIFEDDYKLRSNPCDFEYLRSNYKYRREFYVNPTTKTTNC